MSLKRQLGSHLRRKIQPAVRGVLAVVLLTGCGDLSNSNAAQRSHASRALPEIPLSVSPMIEMFFPKSLDRQSLTSLLSNSTGQQLKIPGMSDDLYRLSLMQGGGFSLNDELTTENTVQTGQFTWKSAGGRQFGEYGKSLVESHLYYQGIPIIGIQIKAEFDQGTLSWINGKTASWMNNGTSLEALFPKTGQFSLDETSAKEHAAKHLSFKLENFHSIQKRYLSASTGLKSVYEMFVSAGNTVKNTIEAGAPAFPLKVYVDADTGDVLEVIPLSLHVEGTAWMYRENPEVSRSEGLMEAKLPSLLGDGSRLKRNEFTVLNCDTAEPSSLCKTSAKGPDFRPIAFENPQYNELVTYNAVSRAFEWHGRIQAASELPGGLTGKAWGSMKGVLGLSADNHLNIFVRALTRSPSGDTTRDNAQYLPGGRRGNGTPEIIIGTGWEQDQGAQRYLIYLGRDSDVSMHEFGHHIVFRSIRDVSGQSGAMHEGFADYFTYAITGNNLLGESIVATGNSLRKGSLSGNVSSYMRSPPHKAGEFWSSALWDVHKALGPWKDDLAKADKIIWDSIDYLKEDAGYYDAIAAIGKSAESFALVSNDNPIELKRKIYAIFASRGFIEKPDNTGNLPQPSATLVAAGGIATPDTNGETTETEEQSQSPAKTKKWYSCGSIPLENTGANTASAIILFIALAVPFLSAVNLKLRKAAQKVRIPAKIVSKLRPR